MQGLGNPWWGGSNQIPYPTFGETDFHFQPSLKQAWLGSFVADYLGLNKASVNLVGWFKPNPLSHLRREGFSFPAFAQASLARLKMKIPTASLQGFGLRSRADSNCCTRFCRPLPSHSATRPIMLQRYEYQ